MCPATAAERLLEETTVRMGRLETADELRRLWAEFVDKAETIVCKGRRQVADIEEDRENVHYRVEKLQQKVDQLEAELSARCRDGDLLDRIACGWLTIDDYLEAERRGWPVERLEMLAGVR